MIWEETVKRLAGRYTLIGAAANGNGQKKNLGASVRPLQNKAMEKKNGVAAPRLVSGKVGVDPTQAAKAAPPKMPQTNGSTVKERAQAYKSLFGGE